MPQYSDSSLSVENKRRKKGSSPFFPIAIKDGEGYGVWYTDAMETVEKRIEVLIDKVRPYIQMHGGDAQLLRVEGSVAHIKVYGACSNCSMASVTYNKTIGPLIIKEVPEITEVEFE